MRRLGRISMVVIVVGVLAGSARALTGSGTQEDPWRIQSLPDFDEFAGDPYYWDDYTRLETDVNLVGRVYERAVIAWDVNNSNYDFDGTPFTGVFDGNAHEVVGLTLDEGGVGNDYLGLFGCIHRGEVKNLGLQGSSVSGDRNIGALLGYNYYGKLDNCFSEGNVKGTYGVGGLLAQSGEVCMGWCIYDELVVNCYSTGYVSGSYGVGGLVGLNDGRITYCYSTGDVSGDYDVGGLVGSNAYGEIGDSFWDIETQTHGVTQSIGRNEGTVTNVSGLTTGEMQDPNTYIEAGWYFGPYGIWCEPPGGGYPLLWWQLSPLPELPFSAGTGKPHEPYLISSADELRSIGHHPRLMNSHFKLVDDINLADADFFIIGNEVYPYSGVFDGNNHTISNFTYESKGSDSAGLFGHIEDGEIKNLGLIDPNVDASAADAVGSLLGNLHNGRISNCYGEGGRIIGRNWVGGLVGANGGMLSDCHSTGDVGGAYGVGGLVGENASPACTDLWCPYQFGMITGSSSAAYVSGTTCVGGLVGVNPGTVLESRSGGAVSGVTYVGGLVGANGERWGWCGFGGCGYYDGTISNSYSTSGVFGIDQVGGLVGQNGAWVCWPGEDCWYEAGTITHSYSTGVVEGEENVGGLVAFDGGGPHETVEGSFWDVQTSGQSESDGGTEKTTAEMHQQSTFTDWDFINVWDIGENQTYPYLRTVPAGDINKDRIVNFLDLCIVAEEWMREE